MTTQRQARIRPPAPDQDGASSGSRIAVIDKAALVLDALLDHPRGATPTEVSEQVGINRSTAFRLLTSLEHAGLLDRDAATGRYRLGLRLMVLGDAVRQSVDLVRLAEPMLIDLREQTRQTVFLSVRDGWGAVCLLRLPGPDVDVLGWKLGQWLPLHVGAAPRALLAALPDDELHQYLQQTGDRTTRSGALSDARIRAVVTQTRRRGWALNREDITHGVSSVGVAVRPAPGAPPACALSVAGLSVEFGDERLEDLAAALTAAAARLAAVLTGRA